VARPCELSIAIMKACLFDLQILADELELALQGDLVLPPRRSRAMRSKSPRQTSRWLAAIDVFLQSGFQWCEDCVNKSADVTGS